MFYIYNGLVFFSSFERKNIVLSTIKHADVISFAVFVRCIVRVCVCERVERKKVGREAGLELEWMSVGEGGL